MCVCVRTPRSKNKGFQTLVQQIDQIEAQIKSQINAWTQISDHLSEMIIRYVKFRWMIPIEILNQYLKLEIHDAW